MALIPWRVKNFVSEHFPLVYHLAVNAVNSRKSADYWDLRLEQTWDAPERNWPAKNELIASLTSPARVVLDIGCGNGSILRDLKRRGYRHLHGMEISQYAVQRLRREGIEMHAGFAPSIPLPDGTFDTVIASQVLEHVIRRRKFLKEIRRVLKPAGHAFIFVPDNCLGPIDEHEHVAKYNAQSLRVLLSSYFSIITVESMRDENCPLPILFAHVAKTAS
jgi:SAM-dependent methyltransferase